MSKFNVLLEKELERYQSGGFFVGDRVRFKQDCLKHPYISNSAESYRNIISSCCEPGFDLNLRVGAIKSIYPTTTQNYQGGSEAPAGVFLDVYIEYAPGLYRNPMTVPLEVLEVINDGINTGPVPNSLRRKSKIHGPEEVEAKQPDVLPKSEINLTNKNFNMPGGNKWDDSKPGSGNF